MHKEYHIRVKSLHKKNFSHRNFFKGHDQNGMFEVHRRYSDFVLIREILVEKWPGVPFKELPPRFRTEGDVEETFQKIRSRGLIEFLQNVTLMPDVFHSGWDFCCEFVY